jgi:hypothetical protein
MPTRLRQPPPLWLIDALVIAALTAVVLWQLHPSLLLTNTTTTGGDNGGHYAMPYFLGHNLIPHGQLTGWYPGWFDGIPLYTFYFVLPDAFAALAAHVISYNVAFKLATVLGSLLLPVCALALGRLARLRVPIPAALAAATLPYLFNSSYTIDGGNLFSTLAGEYSFSLALALALLFLGLYYRVLQQGKGRVVTILVLAACILAHSVPAMYAITAAILLTAAELLPDRAFADPNPRLRSVVLKDAAIVMGASALLVGFWLVPALADWAYTNPMHYLPVTTYRTLLLPNSTWWVLILAATAVPTAIFTRSRFAILLIALSILSALAVCFDPFGSLYNPRFVPLWFISVFLLAGWQAGLIVSGLSNWYAARRTRPPLALRVPRLTALVPLAAALLVVLPPLTLPDSIMSALHITPGADQVSAWATWNYSGYEAKPAAPEFKALIKLMDRVSSRYGCAQATWEYSPDLNRFGSTMSLMQLPMWTNGCVGSTEGLLFESSATTPYHFINQSELSDQSSQAQPGLDYAGTPDVATGVAHLQLLGIRYFMASSPSVEAQAAKDPALTQVGTSGPWPNSVTPSAPTRWDVYLIAHSASVVPLRYSPVVVHGLTAGQSSWLPVSQAWYVDPSDWPVPLASNGPASWPRTSSPTGPPRRPLPSTTVTDINVVTATAQSPQVSFSVSRIGVPVLVKVSYFPNWHASGATGPWRVTPNLMVVVPSSHHVVLTYGSTPANSAGQLATLAGLLILLVLGILSVRARRHPVQ